MPNERTVAQVRLTARTRKRVEALAARDSVTFSDFVRQLIREALNEKRKGSHESS